MIWTRNKPTKAGWWWYRKSIYQLPSCLYVNYCAQDAPMIIDSSRNLSWLSDYDGEWSSEPIEEPKEA